MQVNSMSARVWSMYLAIVGLALLAGTVSAAEKSAIDTAIKDVLKASKKANVDTDFKPLVEQLLKITDDAIDEDNYPDAARAMTMAADMARKAGNNQLAYRASQKSEEVKILAKEYKQLAPALKKLASDENDVKANRAVGLFRCLGQRRWGEGADLLSKTNDDRLKEIGRQEVAPPASPQDEFALATEWQEAAVADNGWLQQSMLRRAHHWAAKAFRQTPSGAEHDKIYEVMSTLPIMYLTDMREVIVKSGPWGLGKYGDNGTGRRITVDDIKYDLAFGVHPPSDDSFVIRYKINGQYRTLNAGCGLCDSEGEFGGTIAFSIVGDGRQLWSSQAVKKRRDAQFATVNVKGIQTLELRCEAKGNSVGGHGVWLDPCLSK
ncbi:MAG: hypothetical protein JWP89_3618 [Schlesneria sp.]|nr:hypothetical protein [Schlesneria sp.]